MTGWRHGDIRSVQTWLANPRREAMFEARDDALASGASSRASGQLAKP